MLIVPPKVELMKRPYSPIDRARHVELCGRVCYKSEEKIAEGTAEQFIANLIKRGHEAMLEHSRVMIRITREVYLDDPTRLTNKTRFERIRRAMNNEGLADYMTITGDNRGYLVSANMRAWRNFCKYAMEKGYELPDEIVFLMRDNPAFFPEWPIQQVGQSAERFPWQYWEDNVKKAHNWFSFRITCDRGVSHEMVRHRPASFAQESTRYCNYSKGQFGGQITVIEPCFFLPDTLPYQHWKEGCEAAERAYFDLLNDGCSPQQARTVLPNSLKTEIIMTATAAEWLHFLGLRMDKAAHPQMREIATQIGEILVKQDAQVFQKAVERIKANNEQ